MKGILQFLLVIIIKARNVHWQDFRWCVAGARWHWPKVYISLVWLLAKQRSFRTFMATTNAEMQQKSGNKITRDKISTYFRYKTAVMAASIGTGTCTPTLPIRENGNKSKKGWKGLYNVLGHQRECCYKHYSIKVAAVCYECWH